MTTTMLRVLRGAVIAAAASSLLAQGPGSRHRVDSFRPLASFNIQNGLAEIVDASSDGKTLVYTDSQNSALGLVDISDPSQPTAIGSVAMPGEPTSVSVAGDYAFCAVWVDQPSAGSPPPAFLPGALVVVDLNDPQNPSVLGQIDIGFHPDSCKAQRVRGAYHVIVCIENEPVVVENGLVTGDDEPGNPADVSPAGLVQVVNIDLNNVAGSTVHDVMIPAADLTSAGCLYPDDPQPEFVDWHGPRAAVSLQENNGIAIVDLSDPTSPALTRVFSTGVVSDRPADLQEDDDIQFVDTYPLDAPVVSDGGGNPVAAGSRMPDAIAFTPDGRFLVSADEGELDFTGGRGWSIWGRDGTFVGDDGGELEHTALVLSHYPEGRSENRGIEVEGIATGRFGNRDFAFVMSERGSFMAVYRLKNGRRANLVQVLPTGISPEGIVVIEGRRLVITADEVSGTLTIFQGQRGTYRPSWQQPTIYSADFSTAWAAISGLCGGAWGQIYGVPDNALPTAIYQLRTGWSYAPLRIRTPVMRNGQQARYDGEGICRDTSIASSGWGGFWICSEGNGSSRPNLAVQIDRHGDVVREIQLPFAIDGGADQTLGGNAQGPASGAKIRSNGFEGITLSSDGRWLYVAVQREFTGPEFPTGPKYSRIGRYDLQQLATAPNNGLRYGGDWEFFYYQLDSNDPSNWAGLSEITALGNGRFLVIERDKGIGAGSLLKKVYGFNLDGLQPDSDGVPDSSDTITKVEFADVLDEFSPYEKIEGLAIAWGSLWVGLDNDGGEVASVLRRVRGIWGQLGF